MSEESPGPAGSAGAQGSGGQAAGGQEAGVPGAGEQALSQHNWDVPWIEAIGVGQPERARLAAEFGEGFRKTNSLMQLMGQAAADRVGLNATDLNCLNILSFSGEMTAGELARETGLTTASITGVADRLEEAGFVTRERDPHDRRRVVVQINLERAMKDVAKIFAPMLGSWREMAARYSDDELRLIVDFYGRMEQVFRDHLVRLRDGPEATEP